VASIIKKLKFDGIIYKSSLRRGGKNAVIFDQTKCKAIKTDMITVKSVKVAYEDFYKDKNEKQ